MEFHLGLDATDSPSGGCTTWTMSHILDDLYSNDSSLVLLGYPRLIRLNPNVPYKTRGNAALALHFQSTLSADEIMSLAIAKISMDRTGYELERQKEPGLILVEGTIKADQELYNRAIHLTLDHQELIIHDSKSIHLWPEFNRSHIGAFAAITADLTWDCTFECITYRTNEMLGQTREISYENLESLITKYPDSFSSIDKQHRRELVAPSGPDPVLFGIRAETAKTALYMSLAIQLKEPIESLTIFQTNQATNAHVREVMSELHGFASISSMFIIQSLPTIIKGGHVMINALMDHRKVILLAFEPTKELARIFSKLIPGDIIFGHGGTKQSPDEISLEYMRIVHLAPRIVYKAPLCDCGTRMTKSGNLKGYKCTNCNAHNWMAETTTLLNPFFVGQQVYASPSAQRHLTRPLHRLHQRNHVIMDSLHYNDVRRICDN